jgi:hypothetical protein
VVVDNTNVRFEDRAALIEQACPYSARVIGFFFPSTAEDSLRRNASRSGRALVPEVGIKASAKALVLPSLPEGFAELYEVRIDVAGFVVRQYPGEGR